MDDMRRFAVCISSWLLVLIVCAWVLMRWVQIMGPAGREIAYDKMLFMVSVVLCRQQVCRDIPPVVVYLLHKLRVLQKNQIMSSMLINGVCRNAWRYFYV